MRMIVALVLALGMGLAGFAVYMAQDYMADMSVQRDQLLAAQRNAPQLMDVVVAKRALKYGERFTLEDLEVVKVQAGKAPQDAYSAITGHKVCLPRHARCSSRGKPAPAPRSALMSRSSRSWRQKNHLRRRCRHHGQPCRKHAGLHD